MANKVLANKEQYIALFGERDVELLLFFLTSAKFNEAIANNDREKYNLAVEFTKEALSQEWVDDILPGFEKDFLKAQGKWHEVFEINQRLKDNAQFSDGAINHFCWEVYKKCEDQKVIAECLVWMNEVTQRNPSYAYLDTYAFLLYKSNDKQKSKVVAEQAIEAAKRENQNPKLLEELIKKL